MRKSKKLGVSKDIRGGGREGAYVVWEVFRESNGGSRRIICGRKGWKTYLKAKHRKVDIPHGGRESTAARFDAGRISIFE